MTKLIGALGMVCVGSSAHALAPVVNCSALQNMTVYNTANGITLSSNGGSTGPSAEGSVVANIQNTASILPQVTVTTPTYAVPSHCRVSGTTSANNAIRFELRMPDNWNGKFFFQGGAGTDGLLQDAWGVLGGRQSSTALGRGYAVVSMDSGHRSTLVADVFTSEWYGSLADFGTTPVMRTDYAYKAVGTMTDAAKLLIKYYYGRLPHKSYFVGCSNGGRQAFLAATRFASKFDGVLAGAPAINISKQLVQAAYDAQELSRLANRPWDAISREDMTLVGSRIRQACDGLDGAADGMVADVPACQSTLVAQNFPNNLICQGGATTNCLSALKVDVLKNMMKGPRAGGTGPQLYADWSWDPGMETKGAFSSWRAWRFSYDVTTFPIMTVLGGGFLAKVANSTPEALGGSGADAWAYLQTYQLSQVPTKMDSLPVPSVFTETPNAQLRVPTPHNLSTFKNKGGKIIAYTGSADPTVSLNDITNWYQALMSHDPGYDSYSRLYVVPGMNHCSGGPATDKFDLFTSLENWTRDANDPVNPGAAVAPGLVVGAVRSDNDALPSSWSTDRERPLCKYPKVARHNGAKNWLGAPDYVKHTSFTCQPVSQTGAP